MEIKKILEKKKKTNFKKENSLGLIFELFEKNNIKLDEKEKITFEKYIKNSKLEEREVFDVINTLLKDKNKDTTNIKGRIVAELKKNYNEIKKSVVKDSSESMMISTHIQTRHIPFFSPSTKRKKGELDSDNNFVIRKFIDNDYSITLYNQDLNFFDEKILYILCTLAVNQKTKRGEKIHFSLRGICRLLKINNRFTVEVKNSIKRLNSASFEFKGFIFGDENDVAVVEGFSFINNFQLNKEREDREEDSYVILNEVLGAQIGNLKKFKKVEKKKYLHISNGWEFKIFSYVDILAKGRKEITVDTKTLLCRGLSICGEEFLSKLKRNNEKIRKAIKKLKENEIIKDYKVIGRGKDIKITFYF